MQSSGDQFDATSDPAVEQKPRPQFGLGWLFRITALLAVVSAVVAWVFRKWPEDPGGALALLAFVFWPSIVVVCVWNWPWISSAKRRATAWTIGMGGLACFWIYAFETNELDLAFMATGIYSCCIWLPQIVFIYIIVSEAKSFQGDESSDT